MTMVDALPAAPTHRGRSSRGWTFIGRDALPDDPMARRHERRGRRWLVVSYVLCPCHIPITLAVLGALLGGSAVGAVVARNAVAVGVGLTVGYAGVLWLGFRQIRIAKRLERDGFRRSCGPADCEVVPSLATPSGNVAYRSGSGA